MVEITGWSAQINAKSGVPPVHHGTSGFIPMGSWGGAKPVQMKGELGS